MKILGLSQHNYYQSTFGGSSGSYSSEYSSAFENNNNQLTNSENQGNQESGAGNIAQGPGESQRHQEILNNDFELGTTIQKAGTEGTGFDLGGINALNSIIGNPKAIINLIVTNYSTVINPQTAIRLNRIRRQKQFYQSKKIEPTKAVDANFGNANDLNLGNLNDPIIQALVRLITGQDLRAYNDTNYQYQLAQYSQSALVHYLLTFIKLINWDDAARIYSSYKFHDPMIFQQFRSAQPTLLESYSRFIAITNQASGVYDQPYNNTHQNQSHNHHQANSQYGYQQGY